MPRWLTIGLLGCGGLLVLLVILVVVVVALAPSGGNQTSQGGGGEAEEKQKKTPKTKTGPENVEATVGETAELQDRTLVVNEVERNFSPPTRASGLKPGNEFVRVFITLTNTSNQTFDYNPNNFKMQDSAGVQQTPRSMAQLPYSISHGSLAPGGTLEGNMVVQVPQGDSGLSLVYEPFERGLGTITVTL